MSETEKVDFAPFRVCFTLKLPCFSFGFVWCPHTHNDHSSTKESSYFVYKRYLYIQMCTLYTLWSSERLNLFRIHEYSTILSRTRQRLVDLNSFWLFFFFFFFVEQFPELNSICMILGTTLSCKYALNSSKNQKKFF